MKMNATKYNRGGTISFDRYLQNNELCMIVNRQNLTVNLPETPPLVGHVWIKDWSENEGVYQALIDSGVIEATPITMATGFVEAKLGKLTEAILNDPEYIFDAKLNDIRKQRLESKQDAE